MTNNEIKLSRLLTSVAESLDIPESYYDKAKARYTAIGHWLCREDSDINQYQPKIYPQGSFSLGTMVKPHSEKDEYDIDLVCEVMNSKDMISQKELKDMVGSEIQSYADSNGINSQPEEKHRCWRINYADGASFHMDIVPSIPEGDSFGRLLASRSIVADQSDKAIAITDNRRPNYSYIDSDWAISNPRGYAEWFKMRMQVQFQSQKEQLAKTRSIGIDKIPEYRVKTPLQRAIQILKRHRDIMFANDLDNRPISVIITTLAALAYDNEENTLQAITKIIKKMPNHIINKEGVIWVANPVNPLENFADKWQEFPSLEQSFKLWMAQVEVDLNDALLKDDIQSMGGVLKTKLGDAVLTKTIEELSNVETGKDSNLSVKAYSKPYMNLHESK